MQNIMDRFVSPLTSHTTTMWNYRSRWRTQRAEEHQNLRRLITQLVSEGAETIVLCDTAGKFLQRSAAWSSSFVDKIMSNKDLHQK